MRRRHCKQKTKTKHGPIPTNNTPLRKKLFRHKVSDTLRGLTVGNTSRNTKKPSEEFSPPSKMLYSNMPTRKEVRNECCVQLQYSHNKSPMTLKKQNHTTISSLRPITKPIKKNKLEPYEGLYKCWGLSPKEKMQIIGDCQSRLARYLQLKKRAADATKNNKIFTVYGSCKTVRNALVERGWVEKLPAHRMNMNNIHSGRMNNREIRNEFETLLLSHLVEKHAPSFIWRTKEHQADDVIDMTTADYVPIVNKLQIDAAWTTKQGLCATMKRNYWFYIENVAEVFCPRTYSSCDPSEVDSFKHDFKITACTSLLKWVLSMVANHRPVFVSNGTVSINVILFAVNRCKEYIYRKQNKDIDKTLSNVSPSQWNTFIKNYYRIISKAEHFKMDKDKQLPLYLGYAKLLLKEIHKYRPQLSCEGCHNMWIIKPAHCCRGRGIKLASKLDDVNEVLGKAKAKYVVQKYIEEPLLIHDTKFDIRQYYLITSTCPLVIWMYKDCYLKFSSQKYNLRNYHESIHLTNNAVQKKYKNCDNRHEELPLNNMWELDKYLSYLKKSGNEDVWDSIIYPGMRKAITSIVLGCQDSMVPCKNRFELYGCDFLLDKDYKPWLIEINSCPDLNHTTSVTAKICPAVVRDIINVVIDYAQNPSSSTGKFECIYRQPFTIPRFITTSSDLTVYGYTLPPSYFYKGKQELKDPLVNIDNQLDITAAMKTMKTMYDTREDISEFPELPESDSQCWLSTCLSPTRSGDRMSDVIQVISDPNVDTVESDHNHNNSKKLTEYTNVRDIDTIESYHNDNSKNLFEFINVESDYTDNSKNSSECTNADPNDIDSVESDHSDNSKNSSECRNVDPKFYTVESDQNDNSKNSSESTNAKRLKIITVDGFLSKERGVDLIAREDPLLDLSPPKESKIPLIPYDDKQLSTFSESNSEYQNAATKAIFNLLAFLQRKETEEKERNMNLGKFKGR